MLIVSDAWEYMEGDISFVRRIEFDSSSFEVVEAYSGSRAKEELVMRGGVTRGWGLKRVSAVSSRGSE